MGRQSLRIASMGFLALSSLTALCSLTGLSSLTAASTAGPETALLTRGFAPLDAYGLEPSPQTSKKADEETERREELAKLRKALLGPDPEPVGSEKHTLAIVSLVRSDDPAAHAILRQFLLSGDNAKLAPPKALRRVLGRLVENAAIELSAQRLAKFGQDSRVARIVEIYASYVPTLIRLRASKLAEDAGIREAVQRLVRFVPGQARRAALLREIRGARGPARADALRLAAETEDLRLASELAKLLSSKDRELIADVQAALGRLTLRAEPFHSLADYERWERAHEGKSYSDLAREAALLSLQKRSKQEQRHAKKLYEMAQSIARLALASQTPAWDVLQGLLEDPVLAAHRADLQEQMYRGLGGRRFTPKELNGSVAGLDALLRFLDAGFERNESMGIDVPPSLAWFSLYAECARIRGGEERKRCEERLRRQLVQVRGAEEGRIFELLTLFPSPEVYEQVVQKLEKDVRDRNYATLKDGLECIAKLGISKDAELAGVTERFLAQCIRNDKIDGAGDRLRFRALEILGGMQRPSVLALLRSFVISKDGVKLREGLRLKALAWVTTQSKIAASNLTGQVLSDFAEGQLQFLLSCLADHTSPRLRIEAMRILEDFPRSARDFKAGVVRDFARRIIAALREELRQERDSSCLAQSLEALTKQSGRHRVSDKGLEALVLVLEDLSGKAPKEEAAKRRAFLEASLPKFRDGFSRLLLHADTSGPHVLALAKKLVAVKLERLALLLLDSQVLGRALADASLPAGAQPEDRAKLAQHRLQHARLTSQVLEMAGIQERLPESERTSLQKAIAGNADGFRALSKEQAPALLYLGRAQLALGQTVEAESSLQAYLALDGIPANTVLAARRNLADALLANDKPLAAAKVLDGDHEAEARLKRGEAYMRAKKFDEASKVLQTLLASGALPAKGKQVKLVRLDLAECQIELRRFADVDRTLAGLPPTLDAELRSRLAVLRKRLEDGRKKAASPGKEDAAKAAKKGNAKRRAPATPKKSQGSERSR